MTRRKNPKRRVKRIYYGPEGHELEKWWTVKVTDAKRPVTINGDIIHALKSSAGVTVGCGLSNMVIDKKNRKEFPHPVFLASFTKSTALLVDKLKRNGEPVHAILYKHSYGHITDRNDDRTLKRLVKDNPALIERPFTLRPPRKARPTGTDVGRQRSTHQNDSGRAFNPVGALARAAKAKIIGQHVADQLTEITEAA